MKKPYKLYLMEQREAELEKQAKLEAWRKEIVKNSLLERCLLSSQVLTGVNQLKNTSVVYKSN